MTKSDYPQDNGAPLVQPQPQAPVAPGQPPLSAQGMQPVQAAPTPAAQPQQPGSEYIPQVPVAATHEHAPVPEQPVYAAPAPEAHDQVPVDDYQYPEGQSVLPEVPPVAVPPSMDIAGAQMGQKVPQNQMPESLPQGAGGEQISQRLAQLQNQYDDELSGNVQNTAETAPQYAGQMSPQTATFEAHAPQMAAFAPQPAAEPVQQPFVQPVPSSHEHAPTYEYAGEPVFDQGYDGTPQSTAVMEGVMQNDYGHHQELHNQTPEIHHEASDGGGMRKLALGGAFVAALAVGGGAAYTYQFTDLFGGKTVSGAAPTIKAGSMPTRVVKQKLGGGGESLNKAVHNRLGGGETQTVSAMSGGGAGNIVRKTLGGNARPGRAGMMLGGSSGPRPVKTLIVRPDGTILRPAGSTSSDVADSKTASKPKHISISARPKAEPQINSGGVKVRRVRIIGKPTNVVKKTAMVAPSRPVMRKISVKPPAPRVARVSKPSTLSAGEVGTPYVVQVTARTSQTGALAAFADMQQKYPSLIGQFAPDIQRADLGAKGVWYRLRVGPVNSKTAAIDLCSSLKEAGHPGCFVRRK